MRRRRRTVDFCLGGVEIGSPLRSPGSGKERRGELLPGAWWPLTLVYQLAEPCLKGKGVKAVAPTKSRRAQAQQYAHCGSKPARMPRGVKGIFLKSHVFIFCPSLHYILALDWRLSRQNNSSTPGLEEAVPQLRRWPLGDLVGRGTLPR